MNYYNNISFWLDDITHQSINLLKKNMLLINNNKVLNIQTKLLPVLNIFTDLNYFTIGYNNVLLVYDNNQPKTILAKDYINSNYRYKLKLNAIESNYEYSKINAYYAGYDLIFNYLLYTSIITRKYILAGIIDNLPINFISNGISININDEKIKNNIVNLTRSLGYITFIRSDCINLLGNFNDIPVKEKKEIQYIDYNNSYIGFSITDNKQPMLCYNIQCEKNTAINNNGLEILL